MRSTHSILLLIYCMAGSVAAEEPSAAGKAIIQKSASFRLRKFPIGFWNYTNPAEHGQHMD